MARRHLAIFIKGTAEKILSGEKKVEIRLSQSKSLPYLSVLKGDEIYLKNSGGKIIGKVFVDNCLYYENLSNEDIINLKESYSNASMEDDFWERKKKSKIATIIFLKNPHKFISPIVYQKKDRRAWVIMDDI